MTGLGADDGARELSARLNETADKLTDLLEGTLREPDVAPDQARMVLSELATGLEELRVAEEELVVQANQLSESYAIIDAERERYGLLFEFAPDGYVETDTSGRILEANTAATRLLGVPARFLHDRVLHSFVAPAHRKLLRDAVSNLVDGAASEDTLMVQLLGRDLPAVDVEIRLAIHTEPRTGVQRMRWLIRDITDRVKLERELHELHSSVELLTALSNVGRLVETDDDGLASLLDRLVALAHSATGAGAGVMVFDAKGGLQGRAATGVARELGDIQLASGGPALEAQATGRVQVFTGEELDRWPELRAAAEGHGIAGVVAIPIRTRARVVGTLNLYAPGSLREVLAAGELVAENAAGAIANAEVYRESRNLVQHLTTALESRGVIDQAKGILMATQRCDADEAFDLLRRASQRENRKLRDIAQDIVSRAAKRST